MKRFIIDTDTASDDAVALIIALRDKSVKVEAVTVTYGNMPIELAERNALISVEMAGTYHPPVYVGMTKPMIRDQLNAKRVHGEDGLGDVGYPDPTIQSEKKHAVDAIIDIVRDTPEIEIITLGPLTNIAMAMLKAPDVMKNVAKITMMGGAQLGFAARTPTAEFNIFSDPEAADIVFQFGVPFMLVPLEVCYGDTEITKADMDTLKSFGNKIADFCVDCNASLAVFNEKTRGRHIISLPDPTAVAAAIRPELMEVSYESYTRTDTSGSATYGQTVIDLRNPNKNSVICAKMKGPEFKQYLFDLVK